MLKVTAVMLATTALVSCGAPSSTLRCRTGDMTSSLDTSTSQGMQALYGPWIRNARECIVGDYVITVPAEAGSGEILVGRQRRPVFYSDPRQTSVLDPSGTRIVFNSTKGGAPNENTRTSYATFDPIQNAWIETVDNAGDGSVDFRLIERQGQEVSTEYIVDQRWLELVRRGTLSGVVLDGEFMTPAAAREKLSARRAGSAR